MTDHPTPEAEAVAHPDNELIDMLRQCYAQRISCAAASAHGTAYVELATVPADILGAAISALSTLPEAGEPSPAQGAERPLSDFRIKGQCNCSVCLRIRREKSVHPAPTTQPTDVAGLREAEIRTAVQNGVARSMAEDEQWLELSGPARAVLMLNVSRHVTAALALIHKPDPYQGEGK